MNDMKKERMMQGIGRCLFGVCMVFVSILGMGVSVNAQSDETAPQISGLEFQSEMTNQFAEKFHIYYYNDDYTLIDVPESGQFLLVPEGAEAPDGLDEKITVLQKPLDKIYMAATSSMSLFSAIDALDSVKFSSLQESGWYIDAAKEAMADGSIVFAGKYSEPDYELLVNSECDLAIESTMIQHAPKVQEMIEQMGIPVFIDHASYETHPLGRTEWVKVYAEMVDKREEAAAFFDEQARVITDLEDFQNTEKTVAFFYVNSTGSVVVRKSDDYVPKMIEIAGGRYLPSSIESEEESKRSSLPMTMEEFYAEAIDADYLIYNGTIDDPVSSIGELLAKSELFADFKAVQEGNVWGVDSYLYQATDIVGNLITDFHVMLTDGEESQMTFLTKID